MTVIWISEKPHTKGPYVEKDITTGSVVELPYLHLRGEGGAAWWELSGFIPWEDARLMAAAPQLLAVLRQAMEYADAGEPISAGLRARMALTLKEATTGE